MKTIIKNDTIKSIVVWGSPYSMYIYPLNISMNNLLRSLYTTLTNHQYSIIIGIILSDAHLAVKSNPLTSNARLEFEQSLSKFEFFWNVFLIFTPFCKIFPRLNIRKRQEKTFFSLVFLTRALPCFTEIQKLFYINKVKTIPSSIFHLIDAVALAYWIMGDGQQVIRGGLTLCTDSYSIKDTILLLNVLIIKFNLKCSIYTVKPEQYRIRIWTESMVTLQNLVKPYILPSMLYKIGL